MFLPFTSWRSFILHSAAREPRQARPLANDFRSMKSMYVTKNRFKAFAATAALLLYANLTTSSLAAAAAKDDSAAPGLPAVASTIGGPGFIEMTGSSDGTVFTSATSAVDICLNVLVSQGSSGILIETDGVGILVKTVPVGRVAAYCVAGAKSVELTCLDSCTIAWRVDGFRPSTVQPPL